MGCMEKWLIFNQKFVKKTPPMMKGEKITKKRRKWDEDSGF